MWAPSAKESVRLHWTRVREQMDLRPCDGCSLCKIRCSDGVQMTLHEYRAVREYIDERVDPDALGRVLGQDKQVDLGDGVQVTVCRYLDMESGGCAVYEARPLVCRLLGHVEWLPCPVEKIEKMASTEDAVALMRSYAGEERHTFEEWERFLATGHPEFELDDSLERIVFERVHRWLANSYWSPGIAREKVERAARNSALVVGAYTDAGQVGYLRVVSDKTTFAWLCDVIVDEEARGRGVGRSMVRFALQHPDFQGLRRWVLATRDAHGVYADCGFDVLQNPERWMICLPNPVPGVDECR